jgi:ABC-type nitrate/sulfonate/bicarbonate transport system substrate-binding protein
LARAAIGPVAAVTVAALLVAGCSSATPHPSSAASLMRQKLVRQARADDGSGRVLRLGLVPEVAEGTGLAGIQLGYLQQALGASARLQVVSFPAPAAEAQALAAGRLDAAYLDPVTAVRLWLASHGSLLKVVAGAASHGRSASAVLVITQKFLARQRALADALLKGDILACQLLTTDPARARPALGIELGALLGHGIPARKLARSFRQVTYTNDPLPSSVLAQARHATAAGLLGPLPASLAGLYHLGPLNKLLRSAGEPAVPG